MKTFSTKSTQKGGNRANSNESSWHQNSQRFSAALPKATLSDPRDNRPEAVVQRDLQETVNSSPQVEQAADYQQMVDNSPRVGAQAAFQRVINISPRMASQRQQLEDASGRAVQEKKNNTGLPDGLKAGLENLSGLSMDEVNVYYNSAKPAQLQALAYTQGKEIHVGPGQERHLPHEAWHVIQQQQGRVKPTTQAQGLAINDDMTLEHEADVMGAKAMQMHRSEKSALGSPLHMSGFRSSDIIQRTKPDTPQILGTEVEGPIPLAERRVVHLTMSQGVVANLRQLSFYSDEFSSCSPVVMYNDHTLRGGLFHFPGGGLDPDEYGEESRGNTQRRLKQMFEDVGPTNVWLNNRFSAELPFLPADVGPITEYLRTSLDYEGEIHEIAGSNHYSFYLDDAMAPQVVMGEIPVPTGAKVSVMSDRTEAEREELADEWLALPLATKYGINKFSEEEESYSSLDW